MKKANIMTAHWDEIVIRIADHTIHFTPINSVSVSLTEYTTAPTEMNIDRTVLSYDKLEEVKRQIMDIETQKGTQY